MTDYQANIYPSNVANPTITHADAKRKNIAVCFSGGGSRALTCAWGQLIGLNTLKAINGKPLLDEVRYISSVSGGSWAAVLYTFRPEHFTDAEFLGNSYSPSQLYYDQDKPGGLNVSKIGSSALGKIPQNFSNLFENRSVEKHYCRFYYHHCSQGNTSENFNKMAMGVYHRQKCTCRF